MMPRLYDELAWIWPLLSPPQDYEPEARLVRDMLHQHLGASERPPGEPRADILELGAGGGHTLYHLRDEFHAVAVDLSRPMLENCRALNPDVETIVGDMRSVRLGRVFDAVLIHDAIDYMTSEDDLAQALATAHAHLRPGGMAIVAPTYTRETFTDRELATDQNHDDLGRAVSYVSYISDTDPQDDVFELILVYLIHESPDSPVRVEHDRHCCGLFDAATWCRRMTEAGFSVQQRDEELADHGAWTCFLGVRQ